MKSESEIVRVNDDVVIEIDERGTLNVPPYLEERVEAIWRLEKSARGDKLFNGIIFNAVDISSERIVGHWMPYRYALAGYCEPSLGRELGTFPLAVNGITRCQGKLLVALRSPDVVSYPNTWELAPSGGLDPGAVIDGRLDGRRGLLNELAEEVGIKSSEVLCTTAVAAVKDWSGHALELCYIIDVREVVMQHFEPPLDEYQDFLWIRPDEWEDFVAQQPVVPMSRLLRTLVD